MSKDLVGDWGSDLADGDYACAIAALGVLESSGTQKYRLSSDPETIVAELREELKDGENTPVWRSSLQSVTDSDAWRSTVHTDAAALAAAWRLYLNPAASWRYRGGFFIHTHNRGLPRLALLSSWRSSSKLVNFDELIRWLRHPDVQLSALVIDDARPQRGVEWHWPLRVGVPDGAENAHILDALRRVQNDVPWVRELSQCYTVGRDRDSCDLLIVTAAGAQRLAWQTPARIRASMVVVLEAVPLSTSAATDQYSLIRNGVGAGATAAVNLAVGPLGNIDEWFREVVRELSHDVPVHAAVTLATRSVAAPDPLIVGDPRAMDDCRLLFIAKRHDRVDYALARQRPGEAPLEFEPTRGPPGDGGGSPESLADMMRTQLFTSETVDGMRMLNEFAQREQAQSQERPPRWLQADAWRKGVESPTRALDPKGWNLLTVHIGPLAAPPAYDPFPAAQVDFSLGEVDMVVQVELAGAAVSRLDEAALRLYLGPTFTATHAASYALSGSISRLEPPSFGEDEQHVGIASTTIVLPPFGNSTLAMFALHPAPHADKVGGRISVIRANRVLQTARVSIDVAHEQSAGKGLTLAMDAPIHPRDDDLPERRGYDVAIRMNDIGGKLHLTIQPNDRPMAGLTIRQDETPTSVLLDPLAEPIEAISEALGKATVQWDHSKSLADQHKFGDSLYSLAAHGSLLEQHLRKNCGDAIDSWGRIQLVPETNAFFPIEYVYDGRPPDVKAVVCPNATGALDRGSCERAVGPPNAPSPCPNRASADFVCPMHFWGFSRLIERNAVSRAPSPAPTGSTPIKVMVPSRRPFGHINGLLFAASNRTFKYVAKADEQASERAALIKAFAVFGAITPADAADWAQWKKAAKQKPNLLVLIPHSDKYRNGPALEIGNEEWLGRQQIDPELSGAQGDPQILLLLGCAAAGVTEDFQPYPELFRDAGVSIVLAPVSPVRGVDAVPIAKQLTRHLANTQEHAEPRAFGELLPELRRQLLREGHPGVMSIIGFGDGDWLIGGA